MKLITLPENVAYVLENRTPYHYFDVENRKKIECRLNTQLISPTEAALEISDGIWANIDIDDLDMTSYPSLIKYDTVEDNLKDMFDEEEEFFQIFFPVHSMEVLLLVVLWEQQWLLAKDLEEQHSQMKQGWVQKLWLLEHQKITNLLDQVWLQ